MGEAIYRNRAGVSGLDPIDGFAEFGRACGLLIRSIFTGRLRTRNPLLLAVMTVAAFVCILLEVLAASYVVSTIGGLP